MCFGHKISAHILCMHSIDSLIRREREKERKRERERERERDVYIFNL